MKKLSIALTLLLFGSVLLAQGYKVGDKASDFSLKNVNGEMVSLSDFNEQKGLIVIFTCNHCPFSVAYEDRIIALDKKYKNKGFPVVAINPNDPSIYAEDSYGMMIIRAKEKGFTFPYLVDDKQEVYPMYGAQKTPHIYLLEKVGKEFKVAYIGAIDNSARNAKQVTKTYLSDAIDALLAGKRPTITETKAIGCGIKTK